MALLKAFVCQVVLFGLYKLFLEEIVEAHVVPDELTRNCIVGFVCLVCFGIQIYTDKADEDNAEADENPKSESRGANFTKNSEPTEISMTHETVGSYASSRETARSGIFAQSSSNVKMNGTEVSGMPASTPKTSYNQGRTTNPVLNGFSETNVCEESDDDGIEIDQFVAKKSDEVEQLKTVETKNAELTKEENVTAESKHLREVEVNKPQVVPEEAKQSTAVEPEEVEPINGEDKQGEAEQIRTVEAEDVKVIKSEDVIEVNQSRTDEVEAIKSEVTAVLESKCFTANGEAEGVKTAIEPEEAEPIEGEDVIEAEELNTVEDGIEEVNQSRTEVVKPEGVTESIVESRCFITNGETIEVFKPESVTEEVSQSRAIDEVEAAESEEADAVVESECLLANEEDISLTQDSDKDTKLSICESSETQMTNGIAEESFNNINCTSSNIIEEIKSKESIKEKREIGNELETTLSLQPDEHTNHTQESLPSPQDISNTSSILTKVDNLDTESKNNPETTPLVIKEVSSPSERLNVSRSRQKATLAADVYVAPITIDISFIYACH